MSDTYHVLHNELGGDTLNLFYGVGGHVGTAGVVLTGHEQLVILLIGCRGDQGGLKMAPPPCAGGSTLLMRKEATHTIFLGCREQSGEM